MKGPLNTHSQLLNGAREFAVCMKKVYGYTELYNVKLLVVDNTLMISYMKWQCISFNIMIDVDTEINLSLDVRNSEENYLRWINFHGEGIRMPRKPWKSVHHEI